MQNTLATVLVILSVVAAIASALVSLFGMDLWFAGTQWMLIAIVLGIYGLFAKMGK